MNLSGEKFNIFSHLAGAIVALFGIILLIITASQKGNVWYITGVCIYSVTLFFLYTSSTLFHFFSGKAKRVFHKMDHIAIYLLIAGTYTPFSLVTLHGIWGWIILSVVWVLAVTGIIVDAFSDSHGRRLLPMIIYLVMGWIILIAYEPMTRLLHPTGLKLLLAGGMSYTVGIFFFVFDKKVRHFHGIWHLFVIAGSIFHYMTILFYI